MGIREYKFPLISFSGRARLVGESEANVIIERKEEVKPERVLVAVGLRDGESYCNNCGAELLGDIDEHSFLAHVYKPGQSKPEGDEVCSYCGCECSEVLCEQCAIALEE